MIQKQTLNDETATYALGARCARLLNVGDVVALSGGLGSGKTCFARGLIQYLLGDEAHIPSPSFTLVQSYDTLPPIWHVDLYRLDRMADIAELGLFDALEEAALVIEWPEKMGMSLPAERLDIHLAPIADFTARVATIRAIGPSWEARIDAFR